MDVLMSAGCSTFVSAALILVIPRFGTLPLEILLGLFFIGYDVLISSYEKQAGHKARWTSYPSSCSRRGFIHDFGRPASGHDRQVRPSAMLSRNRQRDCSEKSAGKNLPILTPPIPSLRR